MRVIKLFLRYFVRRPVSTNLDYIHSVPLTTNSFTFAITLIVISRCLFHSNKLTLSSTGASFKIDTWGFSQKA